jgi:hypothetical protein
MQHTGSSKSNFSANTILYSKALAHLEDPGVLFEKKPDVENLVSLSLQRASNTVLVYLEHQFQLRLTKIL